MSFQDNSTLLNLFRLPPEAFRDIFHQIFDIYQRDPISFADIFFDNITTVNPKSVRIICYQLYVNGISLDNVYQKRTGEAPTFLKELDKFPSETIMILLKYKFPAYIEGDLFFLPSLDRYSGSENTLFPTNLDWLEFILDVCIHQQINLNHINQSTGSTCLHSAIRSGSLSQVQILLSHRVDPNTKSTNGTSPLFSAIELLEFSDSYPYPISLNIIRHIRRYGAKIDNVIQAQISASNYKDQINRILSNASSLEPEYSSDNSLYFLLDLIEDLVLLAELDPSIIYDSKYPNYLRNSAFQNTIKRKRDETILVDGLAIGWPYYIDDTMLLYDRNCYLDIDHRATVSSPPEPDEVYRLAFENVPDVTDEPKESQISFTMITDYGSNEKSPPTDYLPLSPTFPLIPGILVPTSIASLPSI